MQPRPIGKTLRLDPPSLRGAPETVTFMVSSCCCEKLERFAADSKKRPGLSSGTLLSASSGRFGGPQFPSESGLVADSLDVRPIISGCDPLKGTGGGKGNDQSHHQHCQRGNDMTHPTPFTRTRRLGFVSAGSPPTHTRCSHSHMCLHFGFRIMRK